jgi:hypothetical protein
MLTRHIIGPTRQLAAGRPTQHRGAGVYLDQIIEVAKAAGELTRHRRAENRTAGSKPAAKGCPVLREGVRDRSESG